MGRDIDIEMKETLFWTPEYLESSAWLEHIPFAFWLTQVVTPRIFVELGTQHGVSYFAFCQAVERLKIACKTYAVDNWKGDEQSGYYSESVFKKVTEYNSTTYPAFSTLLRCTFDEALDYFDDGTIDLLHIDGYHTYESVRHDFENWRPKMSENGIVLLHDTNVRRDEFGVYKLLEELRKEHPVFEFYHGHGLGVVAVGASSRRMISQLLDDDNEGATQNSFREVFSHLGRFCFYKHNFTKLKRETENQKRESQKILSQTEAQEKEITNQNEKLSELNEELGRKQARIDSLHAELQTSAQVIATEKENLAQFTLELEEICSANEKLKHQLKQEAEARQQEAEVQEKAEQALVLFRKEAEERERRQQAQIKQKSSEIERLKIEVSKTQGALKQLEATYRKAKNTIYSITHSNSWRITKPLRLVRKTPSFVKSHLGDIKDWSTWRSKEPKLRGIDIAGGWQNNPYWLSQLKELRQRHRFKKTIRNGLSLLRLKPKQSQDTQDRRSKAYDEAIELCEAQLIACDWYLEQHPDVKRSGMHPAFHYSLYGWREERNPHPLFDCLWYKSQFSVQFGIDPLIQYHRIGWKEGKSPHPLFDGKWYLKHYNDVAKANINPLEHFLKTGWREGRNPNENFDFKAFLQSHADGELSFTTYLRKLLASKESLHRQPKVAGSAVRPDHLKWNITLVLVAEDDCHPVADTLQRIDADKYDNCELFILWPGKSTFPRSLVEKETTLRKYHVLDITQGGLVNAANKAIRNAKGKLVAFLSSDVSVQRGWLERLIDCHESDSKIMVSDGLSNNGRWFRLQKEQFVDFKYSEEDFALLVEAFSKRQFSEIPLVNSGCFFGIDKSAVSEVGLLDATKVGLFTDAIDEFSRRVKKCGYSIALADNVFLFNRKESQISEPESPEAEERGKSVADAFAKLDLNKNIQEKMRQYIHVSNGNKIVVYTAIIGTYDKLREPEYKHPDIDYVCYTTNPDLHSDTFTIKLVDKIFPRDTKNARALKVLSHLFLIGYDYTLWIDGSTRIRGLDFKEAIAQWMSKNSIALHKHVKRNCIYQEAIECQLQKKDDVQAIQRQVEYMKSKSYPDSRGLAETAQLLRKSDEIVRLFNRAWWYFIDNFSIRDQLSFDYVAWEKNIDYAVMPHNQWCNQYFKNYLHSVAEYSLVDNKNSVSIIMLVHNAPDMTRTSIESILRKTRYRNYELIIVDNASDRETKEYLESVAQKHNNVKLITNKENYSFSRGNNTGVRASDAEFVVLINNDVEIIDDNWLNILVSEIKSEPKIGAVGPIMLYPNYTVQSASVKINTEGDSLHSSTEQKTYRHSGFVDAVSAACMLIPREFYWSLDGLDEQFVYGQEDIDLCIKIRQAGKAIKFVAHCEVLHNESHTRTFNEQTLKNRELIKAKWKHKMGFFDKPLPTPKTPKRYQDILKEKQIAYRSFADMEYVIRKNFRKFANQYDIVVGVPRSGMIPAYIIGNLINTRVLSLDEFVDGVRQTVGDRKITQLKNSDKPAVNVLVVDDSINYGNAHKRVVEALPANYNGQTCSYRHLVIYASDYHTNKTVDYLEIVELPRLFQWNYKNHGIAQYSCYDLDGVLCEDPTDEQNDDGAKYIDFIANTKPLHIPNYKIKAIVTSRLEKYRQHTQQWLKDNNVLYDKLYMIDLPSKEERIRQKIHGKFKAEIYKQLTDTYLFFESNPGQAREISKLTGKPVICTENDRFYHLI